MLGTGRTLRNPVYESSRFITSNALVDFVFPPEPGSRQIISAAKRPADSGTLTQLPPLIGLAPRQIRCDLCIGHMLGAVEGQAVCVPKVVLVCLIMAQNESAEAHQLGCLVGAHKASDERIIRGMPGEPGQLCIRTGLTVCGLGLALEAQHGTHVLPHPSERGLVATAISVIVPPLVVADPTHLRACAYYAIRRPPCCNIGLLSEQLQMLVFQVEFFTEAEVREIRYRRDPPTVPRGRLVILDHPQRPRERPRRAWLLEGHADVWQKVSAVLRNPIRAHGQWRRGEQLCEVWAHDRVHEHVKHTE